MTPAPAQPAVLTPEHLAQLAAARKNGGRIRRAVIVALISAWTLAVFAALTLLGSLLFFSWSALAVGLGLSWCAGMEFRGAAAMKRLSLHAPRLLATNQIVLAIVLISYSAWSWFASVHYPSDLQQQLAQMPELAEMGGNLNTLAQDIAAIVYLTVIIAAAAGCGLTALYYFTRYSALQQYLKNTPAWIIDLERSDAWK